MTSSPAASTRRFGAMRILSILVLSGCIAETPTGTLPNFAQGGGSGDPTVRSANPDSGLRSTTVDVRVLGSGFDNGSRAVWALAGDTAFAATRITTNSTRFVKAGELVANITIAGDAPVAAFDIMVVTAGGKKGIGIEKFTVKLSGQTLYGITFQQGIESDPTHPFSTLAKTGDPFGSPVAGSPAYLAFPASTAGNISVCDQDGTGLGATTASWGAYGGVWNGSFSINAKAGTYHVSYVAGNGTGGYLNLVVNAPAVKSNGNLTLTFTNVRGLVAANSTPDGGPKDPQDRCLTFSITATPSP